MLSHVTLDTINAGDADVSTWLQQCLYSLNLIHNLNDLLYISIIPKYNFINIIMPDKKSNLENLNLKYLLYQNTTQDITNNSDLTTITFKSQMKLILII